jgi:hypothetical protein
MTVTVSSHRNCTIIIKRSKWSLPKLLLLKLIKWKEIHLEFSILINTNLKNKNLKQHDHKIILVQTFKPT